MIKKLRRLYKMQDAATIKLQTLAIYKYNLHKSVLFCTYIICIHTIRYYRMPISFKNLQLLFMILLPFYTVIGMQEHL